MNYESPFLSTDTLFVHTNAPDSVNVQLHDSDMDKIKVVQILMLQQTYGGSFFKS